MTDKKAFTHFENLSLDDYPPQSYRPSYQAAHHDRPFAPPPAVPAVQTSHPAPVSRRSFKDRCCHGINIIFGAIFIVAIIFGAVYGLIRWLNRKH